MRVILVKLLLPALTVAILYEPFIGVLFFMLIAFVRLDVLTWGMVDARFALITSVLTLVSWLLHSRKQTQRGDRIPGQYAWFLVILFTMTLSTLFAEASVADSWASVQKFYKYGVFLFLTIQMVNTEKRLRMVQEVLFWGINFLVLWGIDQYFRGNERLEQIGGGDFADSSALAALFLLQFPFVIYRGLHTERWVRWTGYAFAPLYLVAITMTQSRSGFLGSMLALGIIFSRSKSKVKTLLVAIPLMMGLSMVMPDTFWDRMKTIYHSEEEEEKGEVRERSADQRLKIWAVAVEVFKDHPILGVGRSNFGLIHTSYGFKVWYGKIDSVLFEDLFLRYRVCHNIYLDLLVSNGLVTFIPWCLLMISVPYSLSRIRRRLGTSQMDQFWRFQTYAFEIGILGYLITGIFQDLAEVEAFYWYINLSGITVTVLQRRLAEAGATDSTGDDQAQPMIVAPGRRKVPVPGVVTPGEGAPLNPWHV